MSDYRSPTESDTWEQLPTPPRALTIGAHPDDAEFGAGGTLAKWAAAGGEVAMLLLTDGSKGTWDPEMDPNELIELRRREQQAAADRLGATTVVHLDHIDGELEYTMALREQVALWVRRLRPTVVLSHDPWRRYMLHPDHRAAGWAAIDGVVAARDHLFFPDQLTGDTTHHRPDWILLWAADEPDHWEDIGATIEVKIDALLEHSSQGTTTMDGAEQNTTARDRFAEKIRDRARDAGSGRGIAMAEAFKRIQP